jgi:hypothetical protein
LPPAWIAERNRLAALSGGKTAEGSPDDGADQAADTVQVQTVKVNETMPGVKSERRNGLASEEAGGKGKISPRSYSTKEDSHLDRDQDSR